MKVFVLVLAPVDEAPLVVGVFSSRELAEAYVGVDEPLRANQYFFKVTLRDYDIEEYTLDAPDQEIE